VFSLLISHREEEESHRTPDVLTKEDRGTCCLFPEVDLGDLSEGPEYSGDEHVDRGSGLLSKDDDNEGYAKGLQLNIYLRQSSRPEKNYTAIAKPLYPEVKQYFEDLLNRGCVRKVPLSLPVVCVRK